MYVSLLKGNLKKKNYKSTYLLKKLTDMGAGVNSRLPMGTREHEGKVRSVGLTDRRHYTPKR